MCKKYCNFNDILETIMQYSLRTPRNSCRNTDICAMVYHTYGLRIRFSLRLRHLSCLVTRKCNYDNYRLRKNLSYWIRLVKGTYISLFLGCVQPFCGQYGFPLKLAARTDLWATFSAILVFAQPSKQKDFQSFFQSLLILRPKTIFDL